MNLARHEARPPWRTERSAGDSHDESQSPGGTIDAIRPADTVQSEAIDWLKQECALDQAGAEQAVQYIVEGRAVLRTVPTQKTVVAERFFDESGGMQLIIHAPFGGRINKAWGLALRKRFCRSFNFELQAAATDNGLNISLSELHSFPLGDVFRFLQPEGLEELLEQAVLTSPIFTTRWRWVAGRALALLRFQGGKKVPPPIQRMRSDDLLAAVFPEALACQENISGEIKVPDHPLVRETMKDALTEAMDVEGLKQVLAAIRSGQIRCEAVDTPVPSQFSHEILNANPYAYLDDAPLEEPRARAVERRRMWPEAVLTEIGRLDPAAIAQVREEAWPDVRDADELHDTLQTFIAFPLQLVSFLGGRSFLALSEAEGSSDNHFAVSPGAVAPEAGNSVAERRLNLARHEASPPQRAERSAGNTHDELQSPGGTIVPAGRPAASSSLTSGPEDQGSLGGRSFSSDNQLAESHGALASEEQTPLAGLVRRSAAEWASYFDQLVSSRRALLADFNERKYWVAAEKAATFAAIFPAAQIDKSFAELKSGAVSREEAVAQCVTGWMTHAGVVTVVALSEILGLSAADVDKAMLRLEASGSALRGSFTGATETEWCDRRLLARIHRLTLGELRSQIQPATAAQFMRWLLRWQHVTPRAQVLGEHGTLEVLKQLQGFEAPANSWERQILARRIANYDPAVLDQLCLTGAVGWGRISPHPATLAEPTTLANRRVIPTSVAPIAFFVREDSEWMIQHGAVDAAEPRGLSAAARETLSYLHQRGASFFADLVRGTGRLKSEVESALWELVTAGIITADGFDNIRALIDPKRRAGQGRGHGARPRHSVGRWSLLYSHEPPDRAQVAEATCWMLLNRYGIVFREMTARESIVPRWRELLIAFRRLEDRGVIRGGHFVNGFLGEQFALPVAVESLRAARREEPAGEVVTISAADPLNLVGIIVPGERTATNSGKTLTLRDGVPITREDPYQGLSEAVAV